MKRSLVLDTSVYMNKRIDLDYLLDSYRILIPDIVLEELDNHKDNYKDRKRSFLGRGAIKYIKVNFDRFNFENDLFNLEKDSKADNQIISVAKKNNALLATFDISMQVKATRQGIEILDVGNQTSQYLGYKNINLNLNIEEDKLVLASLYEKSEDNTLNLNLNEYAIIRDEDDSLIDIFVWNGELNRRVVGNSKSISPLNPEQRCAIDLLQTNSIPIKIITGGFGSGKTMLATMIGHEKVVRKGEYSKLVLVRNSDSDESGNIGYLPGDYHDKTNILFKTITQHLPQGEIEAESLKRRGLLETHIPYFMKGRSISGYMIVDEAEELTVDDIKKVGSRLEEGSCIVFTGDWEQANGRYIGDSGIQHLISTTKDNPLVGVVNLKDVVRSDLSKVFADL